MTQWRQRRATSFYTSGRDPGFIDYFPEAIGTIPEKMVFNELVRRQINFYFTPYFGDIPFTQEQERYRPDFILPDYRIIIEIYGTYWHTRPGSYEYDYLRSALLTASGYTIHILTDAEVLANVFEAVNTIPQLINPAIHGTSHIIGERPVDPSASLRARLKKGPKVYKPNFPKDRTRVTGRWTPSRPPRAMAKPITQIFNEGDLDSSFLATIQSYADEWKTFMTTVGEYYPTGEWRPPQYHAPWFYIVSEEDLDNWDQPTGRWVWVVEEGNQNPHWEWQWGYYVGEGRWEGYSRDTYDYWSRWREWWERFT